jgi:protein-disulfide isomerase
MIQWRPLLVLGALLACAPSWAAVNVVKLINFNCPHCRASEAVDPPIKAAITLRGGKFVYGALPRSKEAQREVLYYAVRDTHPDMEPAVRASLYKGSQDLNYPLEDLPQVLDWLQQDLADKPINWELVMNKANSTDAEAPFLRALYLADQAGVTTIPAYIILDDDRIVGGFEVQGQGPSALANLRDRVLQAIQALVPAAKE